MLAENTAPTETDLALVRYTFDLVVPISGVAADLFYARLFYITPSWQMFPTTCATRSAS